jgi:hypothetical protein
VLLQLEDRGYVSRMRDSRGSWRLTPAGRDRSVELISDIDIAALMTEAATERPPLFGRTARTPIPPSLAPPELLSPLRSFLEDHPFDANIFGVTRFPDEQNEADPDPLIETLNAIRDTCVIHGLQFPGVRPHDR